MWSVLYFNYIIEGMSDIIQLLPDSIANQIAAGEVIQRPASVVKELVENAVDAGATVINVVIVDAGRTSIQVVDNGKGMTETDARLSFERHATSKIRKADDLFALTTMGFRGEALASIAAVAQVELRTRQEGEELGTHLSIAGGNVTGQEVCSCPQGSNFKVENLFFNVPARRKFLKSNTTELNNIITAFERIALVYPDITFTLNSNGTEIFSLKACSLRQRIVEVFGKRLNQDLLPVDVHTTLCHIQGFVGKPEAAKKKGALQFFFVNDRYMKHPYFNKAVMNAFERLIPFGEQVPYFIYFKVPAENIDVNIHPTKTEIKFENEQAIWQILMASVKEAIGKFSAIPSIDFDTEGRPDIPVYNPNTNIEAPKVEVNPNYNPFSHTPSLSSRATTDSWQELYKGLEIETSNSNIETIDAPNSDSEQHIFKSKASNHSVIEDKSPIHYQYKGCYIMTAVKSGLMIIDQYRAHTRILYEQYLKQLSKRTAPTQKLLFPQMIQMPIADETFIQNIIPELQAIGFELTDMGGGSYAVIGVPTGIDGLNIKELVDEMITTAIEQDTTIGEEIDKALALSLAKNAAIPHGQILGNEEMENLVNGLFACSNVNYAPDGKPIISILKQEEIEHLLR